jgi:hypothetical protein
VDEFVFSPNSDTPVQMPVQRNREFFVAAVDPEATGRGCLGPATIEISLKTSDEYQA